MSRGKVARAGSSDRT